MMTATGTRENTINMLISKTYTLKGLFEHLGVRWDARDHVMT